MQNSAQRGSESDIDETGFFAVAKDVKGMTTD
jgi:hypothetical protein